MSEVKQTDCSKELEIFQMIVNDDVSGVKRLLHEDKVKVDCLDENGMTPLQQAAYKGKVELCTILLNNGADVNSSYQEHGYTALMFAALSGSLEVTQLMLEAGAKVYHENSVGRTAAEMAAFVGQHECVSLINNFFSREDLDNYTVKQGFESEAKLPTALAPCLYEVILNNNLNPAKICMMIQDRTDLLQQANKMATLCETLCQKCMKAKSTNEIMGLKFHYLGHLFNHCYKNMDNLEAFIKSLVKGKRPDGFCEAQEKLLHSIIRDFPYRENTLIQTIVKTLAHGKFGSGPTALGVLDSSINGHRMPREEDMPCMSCDSLRALKKCSSCKKANYCDQRCQKLHWSTHKKLCKHTHGQGDGED